jgi:hypothetical protein
MMAQFRRWEAMFRKLVRSCIALTALVGGLVVAVTTAPAQTSTPRTGILLRPRAATMLSETCSVSQLQLRITTGSDDLRGGNDNLSVQIHFADGSMQSANNVNKGSNWGNNSVNLVSISLSKPMAPGQIRDITLVHGAQGGYTPPQGTGIGMLGTVAAPIALANGVKSEDNWDMAEFQAFALGKGINVPIASFGLHRFTGSDPSLDIHTQPGVECPTGKQVTKISFTFNTSDDDLRGGNDNLNITVLFSDGTSQTEHNVNHSQNWPNGSTKGAEILLNRSATIDQIRGFTLADTFGGGSGGDNWNMASMRADAFLTDGSYHTIAQAGFHRFSADMGGSNSREIRISAHQIN